MTGGQSQVTRALAQFVAGSEWSAIPPEVRREGVRGLLNFAPVSIHVPPDVALNAVDLAVQLEQLSFQVNVSPKLSLS